MNIHYFIINTIIGRFPGSLNLKPSVMLSVTFPDNCRKKMNVLCLARTVYETLACSNKAPFAKKVNQRQIQEAW